MFSNGLSPSDVVALSGNNNGFDGGVWLWIIVIIALLGGWGNGFGGNATNAYATQAELQRGFDNQNVMMKLDTIGQNQTNGAYENAQLINGVNTTMLQANANTNIAMLQGFDGINSNINNLAHQLEQCCCNLKTQMLQDKYDQAQNQLNLAEIASANAVQTNNILGNLGRWYSNPPVNPYYVYGQYGTTIS